MAAPSPEVGAFIAPAPGGAANIPGPKEKPVVGAAGAGALGAPMPNEKAPGAGEDDLSDVEPNENGLTASVLLSAPDEPKEKGLTASVFVAARVVLVSVLLEFELPKEKGFTAGEFAGEEADSPNFGADEEEGKKLVADDVRLADADGEVEEKLLPTAAVDFLFAGNFSVISLRCFS